MFILSCAATEKNSLKSLRVTFPSANQIPSSSFDSENWTKGKRLIKECGSLIPLTPLDIHQTV